MRDLLIPLLACIACAVIVSVTAVSVREKQNENLEYDKKTKILLAAGIIAENIDLEFTNITTLYIDFKNNELVEMEDSYDPIKATFNQTTSTLIPNEKDIAILKRRENIGPVYLWLNKQNSIDKVVVPIRGYGLWGTLYGYLSLDSDLNTVRGIEFYDHKETPGLGAEVENQDWKDLWEGKLLYGSDGGVQLKVVKGSAKGKYQINGLSGATLTSNGVSNMINYWLGSDGYGPALEKIKSLYGPQVAMQ